MAGQTQTLKTHLKAFHALCISTHLNPDVLEKQVTLFTHEKLSNIDVKTLNPDNELGYSVIIDDMITIVVMGSKDIDTGQKSRSCSVTFRELSFNDAKKIVENNFRVKQVDEMKQGLELIAFYRVELAGFSNDIAISIQNMNNLSSLILFEYFQ